MNRYEFAALCRASVPDSPAKRRAEAELARRTLAALRANAIRQAAAARRAAAVKASDAIEAQRFAPFRADGPQPRGRRRAAMAVGTEDYAPHHEMPPAPGVFDVGDDL